MLKSSIRPIALQLALGERLLTPAAGLKPLDQLRIFSLYLCALQFDFHPLLDAQVELLQAQRISLRLHIRRLHGRRASKSRRRRGGRAGGRSPLGLGRCAGRRSRSSRGGLAHLELLAEPGLLARLKLLTRLKLLAGLLKRLG
jgi:hypothetical protein